MSNDLTDIDDDEIPDEAFTGEAPKAAPKAGKATTGPTGPLCPSGCRDQNGAAHLWINETRNGKKYFRCSRCKGCWWPMRDNPKKVDADSKWPPLPPREA